MKKHIKLPLHVELVRYSDQLAISIDVGMDALRDWCLGLVLLRDGLIDMLITTPFDEKATLRIESSKAVPNGRVFGSIDAVAISFKLNTTQLDYLSSLYLKYYRDGYAEIDHVDLAATFTEADALDAYITFKLADFAPPANREETARRLAETESGTETNGRKISRNPVV